MMTIEELKEARQAACRIKKGYADTEGERKIADLWCTLIDAEIARKKMDAKYADSYGSVYDALNYMTGGFSRKWQLDLLSEVLTYMRPLEVKNDD